MQDLRLAVRGLRATPIVTAVAVLSLALGIGANTAIFSLVNSLVLRTLPVVAPQRLVTVSSGTALIQGSTETWTYPIWNQIRQDAQTFDGACAWSRERFNLAQGGEAQPVDGVFVSGDFFRTLGVPALRGRTFTVADDARGGGPDGPVAVISYGLWQRRFGGATNVVGTPLAVERVPFTIVGITPPQFFGAEVGRSFDVALPINAEPLIRGKDSRLDAERGFYFLTVMLRLKPEQSLDAATATLRGVQPKIRDATLPPNLPPPFQEQYLRDRWTLVPAASGTSELREQYQQPLVTIFVIVALVLVIACANLANLLLARATARRHELSLRLALGAPRWRLVRQLMVESSVLAAIGATVGLVFAAWGTHALVADLSTTVNRVMLDVSPDWRVLAFTTAVTLITVLLFGMLPAFRATRAAPMDALKEHGRGSVGDARGNLSSGLVVAQVALSLILVVAAGLFVGTFERLARAPLGFDRDRVLVINVNVTRAGRGMEELFYKYRTGWHVNASVDPCS